MTFLMNVDTFRINDTINLPLLDVRYDETDPNYEPMERTSVYTDRPIDGNDRTTSIIV